MSEPAMIAERYIASWNEADPARRRALIAELWSQDGAYRDPLAQARGLGEIDAMIAAVQERFAGLRFSPDGTADGHGDHVRFSWSLAPVGGPAIARGTDFAVLAEDGRLASVTGFLDDVPAAA